MTREEFRRLLTDKPYFLLDGATGTMLQQRGMPRGVCTELWEAEHPEMVAVLQKEYADAGSHLIYAPTFSASPLVMESHGLDRAETVKLNTRLVENTLRAVGDRALVAGDMTTVAKPMEPYGPLTATQVYDSYCIQAEALAKAGAEVIVAETMMGLQETVTLTEAVRNVCDLPLLCSFSCESDGKCYFDGTVLEALPLLEQLGADAVGINCAAGPGHILSLLERMGQECALPRLAKPNAGMPAITPEGEAVYPLQPEEFAEEMFRLYTAGAQLLGGCCGTTPAHIRALKERLEA